MRSCGLGYNALEKFCGLMNLPPQKNYQKYLIKSEIQRKLLHKQVCQLP